MVNNAVYIICLIIIAMMAYDSGYAAGAGDITTQFTTDLENVLTEGQYKLVPVRTMILFKNIHMVR